MKTSILFLAIPVLMTATIAYSKAPVSSVEEKARIKAIQACDDLSDKESNSWSGWAASQGITKNELAQAVSGLCTSGIVTARNAKYEQDIYEWQTAMFNRVASLGLGPLNVNAVQTSTYIAKEYFRALHPEVTKRKAENERLAAQEKALRDDAMEKEVGFPKLPEKYTQEQFNTAYTYFINTKTVKGGRSIRETCEKAIKDISFLSNYSFMQRAIARGYDDQAVSVCQRVMVHKMSYGKYGKSAEELIHSASYGELNKLTYPGDRYMAIVAKWADENTK